MPQIHELRSIDLQTSQVAAHFIPLRDALTVQIPLFPLLSTHWNPSVAFAPVHDPLPADRMPSLHLHLHLHEGSWHPTFPRRSLLLLPSHCYRSWVQQPYLCPQSRNSAVDSSPGPSPVPPLDGQAASVASSACAAMQCAVPSPVGVAGRLRSPDADGCRHHR